MIGSCGEAHFFLLENHLKPSRQLASMSRQPSVSLAYGPFSALPYPIPPSIPFPDHAMTDEAAKLLAPYTNPAVRRQIEAQLRASGHPAFADSISTAPLPAPGVIAPPPSHLPMQDSGPAPKARKTPRNAKTKSPAKPKKEKVARTRNAGTKTEAQFWGMVRSGLRRTFRFWRPATDALRAARTPCAGPHGQKWAYLCASCGRLFPRKSVSIDHCTPCGSLKSYEEVGEFLRRLTAEGPSAYQVLCHSCHQEKTDTEKSSRLISQPKP
jgi:hypothetical protein